MKLIFETKVSAPFNRVRTLIGKELFQALISPWQSIEIVRFDGTRVGDEVHLNINMGLIFPWISKIVDSSVRDDEWSFIDVGVKTFPLIKSWHHIHLFRAIDTTTTLIRDEINFECQNPFLEYPMYVMLFPQFAFRRYGYKKFFNVSKI